MEAPSPETYLFIFTWTLLWAKAIAYKNHFTVVEDNIRWEIFFENWNKSWDILMDICVWIMQISILKQYLQMRRRSFFIFLVSVSNSILWISSMLWKQSQVISSQSQNANFFPNKSYCFAVQVKIFLEPWPNWLEFFNFDINIGWIHIIQRSTFSLLKMPTSPSTLKSSIYKSSLTGDF